MKRSPLHRKTPLKAKKVPLATTRSVQAEGKKNPRPARRDTGPTAETRRLVMERAHNCCERCGKAITGQYSIHHRKPRGMGGTKDEAINSCANLVLLCGSATTPDGCHTGVERFRKSALYTGFIVARTADPATVPIKMIDGWWVLQEGGARIPTVKPELELEDE